MNRKAFRWIMAELLSELKTGGARSVRDLVTWYGVDDRTGYAMSNARAALLQLAEEGDVEIDVFGGIAVRASRTDKP